MQKSVVVFGTLDTKGEQLSLLRETIASRGHRVVLVDLSLGGASEVPADVPVDRLVQLAGADLEAFHASRDRAVKAEIAVRGAQSAVLELLADRALHGAVALGGASMALMGARILSHLPFGVPKVIATPAAMPAYLSEWFGAMDMVVMQVIMEFTGRNELLRQAIAQVGGAISGMVEESRPAGSLRLPHPAVALTEIGFCPQCAHQVQALLQEKGYHPFTFHAQGISERAMDRLIDQGFFQGVIDIVPAGLMEELFEGNRAAGLERLDAGCRTGIPQVIAPCTVNLTGCGPTRKHRERYASRPRVLKIDELRAMTRFDADELELGARAYAEKLNRAKGPVRLLFPTQGWSAIDRKGTALYAPEQDRIFLESLRKNLKPEVEVAEVDCNLEDRAFAEALVDNFDALVTNARA